MVDGKNQAYWFERDRRSVNPHCDSSDFVPGEESEDEEFSGSQEEGSKDEYMEYDSEEYNSCFWTNFEIFLLESQ